MTSRRQFLGTVGAPLLAASPVKPNIVVILADDLGYSDIGCYGGEIRTPNLDRLAGKGVRFTHFYNTARCCPTRASLMTGLYSHQAGIGHMVNPKPFPAYRGDLRADTPTIAEVLKPAGYRTYMAGKWHVTPMNGRQHNWPRQRGFDRYYGIIQGAANFFSPASVKRDNEEVGAEGKDFYLTDAFAANAVRFIEEQKTPDPFFLYLAFTAPHWPMHALEADIERYRGRYKEGWDVLRAERHQRMTASGIVERRWPLTARDESVPAWKDAPDRAWQERRMEVYAAMVDRMDQNIGRVVKAIEAKGQLDNTLILFMADNGGCAEELGPNTTYQAEFRGNRPDIMPGPGNTFQSYGVGWANASNTPFRRYKHWVHEGGIASPLIAHWPARLKKPGTINASPGHLIDVMATCVDLAQAKAPPLLEGKSLAPWLEGQKRVPHEALFWEHEGNRAVRAGKWKLVSKFPGSWELYDLEADRTELKDMAAAQPKIAARLEGRYRAWAQRAQVVDWAEVQKAPAAPV